MVTVLPWKDTRNEYQKSSFAGGGLKHGWRVRLTTLLPHVSQFSRKCGFLLVSQPYRYSQPITGIAFYFALIYTSINIGLELHSFWVFKVYQWHCSLHDLTANVSYVCLLLEYRPQLDVSLPPEDSRKFLAWRLLSENVRLDFGEFPRHPLETTTQAISNGPHK
jgi:hypothetical protein